MWVVFLEYCRAIGVNIHLKMIQLLLDLYKNIHPQVLLGGEGKSRTVSVERAELCVVLSWCG